MPPETFGPNYEFLSRKQILSFEDIVMLVKAMLPLGLEKVRITGGEPLLRKDLLKLVQFAKEAGIKVKVVPFGSGAQMVQALMAGKIDATLPNVSEATNQVADGTFRALVVLAEKRLKDYPNVPSSYELGIKAKCSTTRGYAVLASTPKPIIEKISKGLVKAMKHKVFANYLASAGLTVEGSVAGTAVWDKHLKEEFKVAQSALKDLGLLK